MKILIKMAFHIFFIFSNFYILLEEKEKKLISTLDKSKKIDKLHGLLSRIISEEETLDSKIKDLIMSNKENLSKIYKEIRKKELCKSYYKSNNEEIEMNLKIRNAFYKFNLEISNFIFSYRNEGDYKIYSKNFDSGDINEYLKSKSENNLELVDNVDNLFYQKIKNFFCGDILQNFCLNVEKKIQPQKILDYPEKFFLIFIRFKC